MTRSSIPATRASRSIAAAIGLAAPLLGTPALALSARETAEMRQLAPVDRMIQVCFLGLEDRIAKETRYNRVDRVVMDAFSRGRIAERTVRAGGAAFRNKGDWFRLRFRCSVTPDRLHVETLRYEIVSQTPVARTEWDAHRLFP
ncbi:DUF930 domain-containing protein [Aureimonas jatrophae]|uniref:DUF930 domain-containing protein n=1 Tax=Aureimonas jatrophae TaxID=1166073 RepID=A0A1H0HSW5_9HYPH|nr:DUF930 domain-containing protein [Aureimonas jatrophae]MBB3950756.1 hypothetical protein [Aureimonas jatrophae]SDO22184.1 protein of unknown function [Aureimonas jatrophae]